MRVSRSARGRIVMSALVLGSACVALRAQPGAEISGPWAPDPRAASDMGPERPGATTSGRSMALELSPSAFTGREKAGPRELVREFRMQTTAKLHVRGPKASAARMPTGSFSTHSIETVNLPVGTAQVETDATYTLLTDGRLRVVRTTTTADASVTREYFLVRAVAR